MKTYKEQAYKEQVYSQKLKAGKKIYFFDVKPTNRSDEYYLTITETRKKTLNNGNVQNQRSKIFLYKEDLNRFLNKLQESIDYIKTELMPKYDFDSFHSSDNDEIGHESKNH